MWNLGGPLTRTPDRMSCSPPDSTPPPPHSSESVVEFNPPLRVGGSRGKTEPSHFSVFKDLQLKSRKPPAAKELSHSFSEAARKAGIQIALRLQEITYSVFPHLGSYSVTWNVAQKKKAIQDGLYPQICQYFLPADWFNIAYSFNLHRTTRRSVLDS